MEEKKDFTMPEGWIDPHEMTEIMRTAREKRQRAGSERFYWFSLLGAKNRWALNGSVASGVFGKDDKRAVFSLVTMSPEKPSGYKDYKFVGKARPQDIKFIGGIDEKMFNEGVISGIKKDDEPKHFYAGAPVEAGGDTGSFGLPRIEDED